MVTLIIVMLLVVSSLVLVVLWSVSWRLQMNRRKAAEILDRAEILLKDQKIEEAYSILNSIDLSSRYDKIGERSNFLLAQCLEKLGRNLEASYEYSTYLGKFPRGDYVQESKRAFKMLWERFGPFDYQKFRVDDACGFAMAEKIIEELTR